MKNTFRQITCDFFAALLIAITAGSALVAAGDDLQPRVALTDFAYRDQPAGLDPDTANLTEAVRALLSGRDKFDWVERDDISRALEEISFGLAGISAESTAVRVGNLVRADMLVRGVFMPLTERTVVLNISVIDSRRADVLAMQGMILELDSRGRIAIDQDAIARVERVVSGVVKSAAERLETVSGMTVMAPLFFRNVGPHNRMDFVEERLFAMLREEAEKNGTVHSLHFSGRTDAEGEAELVLMDLTEADSEAWRKVADVYVWGEFAELEVEDDDLPFSQVPFRIELTLWQGGGEPVVIARTGQVRQLERILREIGEEVVGAARSASGEVSAKSEERLKVAAALKARAGAVERQIAGAGGNEFLRVPEGRRLYAYQLKLLETGCFFDPLDRDLQRRRLDVASSPSNPLDPLNSIGGHWRRIDHHFAHLARFPTDARGMPDNGLRIRTISALNEAARALNRSDFHRLPSSFVHAEKKRIAALMVREIHAFNKESPGTNDGEIESGNASFFELIYGRGIALGPFFQNPEILYSFTEELWPYFKKEYMQWRDRSISDRGFQQFAQSVLSTYSVFGLAHRAVEMLEEGYGQQSHSKGTSARRTSEPPPRNVLREEWNPAVNRTGPVSEFDLPEEARLPASEVVLWPEVFYRKINEFYPSNATRHRWDFLRWEGGLLWVGETTSTRLPADDAWENRSGNHYLWIYDPASGSVKNLSRQLPPHTAVHDLVFDGNDLWLSVAMDGAWKWTPRTGEVTSFGVGDGMVSHDTRAGVGTADNIYFSGSSSGSAMMSRFDKGSRQWAAINWLAASAQGEKVFGNAVRFGGDWLLLLGEDAVFYHSGSGMWRQVVLPRAEVHHVAGRETDSSLVAAEAEDGVWIAGDGFLLHTRPEIAGDQPHDFLKLPGRATAMIRQGSVLWVGIAAPGERPDRPARALPGPQAQPGGPGAESEVFLMAYDLERKRWIGRVVLSDSRIDKLAASANRLWVGGDSLWEIDTTRLQQVEDARQMHWHSEFFGEEHALHIAISRGDAMAIHSLLTDGADPNMAGNRGKPPLLTAVDADNLAAVQLLLDAGADPATVAPGGIFPLSLASERGDLATIQALIAAGADVNEQGPPSPYVFKGNKDQTPRRDPFIDADQSPRPPVNLRAEPISSTTVRLTWEPGCGTESHFRVFRSSLSADRRFTLAAILARGQTSYLDILPEDEIGAETLFYRVVAVNGANANPSQQTVDGVWGRFDSLVTVRMLLLIERGADINAQNNDGDTPLLFEYGRRENLSFFTQLLDRGADVNLGGRYTPLMLATRAGRADDVEMLLARNADIHAATGMGETALSLAVAAGFEELVDLFIERGFDPNLLYWSIHDTGRLSDQVLRTVVSRKSYRLLEKILEAGADTGHGDGDESVLHRAAEANDAEAVEILLRYGADPARLNRLGQTPFDVAREDEVRRLLAPDNERPIMPLPKSLTTLYPGPPADEVHRNRTPDEQALDRLLLAAASKGDEQDVESLLKAGAWIDASDENGRTPLLHGILSGNPAFVLWLLDRNPSLNVVDKSGYSPLSFAIEHGSEVLVRELLDRGASPDLRRKDTLTPLQLAIHRHGYTLASLLLDYGACPRQMGYYRAGNRSSPLMSAASRRQLDTVRLLLDRGAFIDAYQLSFVQIGSGPAVERRLGPNVLFWAAQSNDPAMVDFLIDRGADLRHVSDGGHNPICWAAETGAGGTTAHLLSLGLRFPHSLDPPPQHLSEEILTLLLSTSP